jgi:MFS transporter, DHA1 family, inner membrane transport protein
MTWKERILLLLLASINFTHILDFMIMMPLGNFLMPYFHIDAQQFSMVVASYSISAAVSGFGAAFFVDKFDRKKVLLFGYTGFIIGTICCGIAPTYFLLLISRIVAGLFGGLIGAQVFSIIADSFPYERRGQAMGIIFSAFSLASIIGVPFSLYLAESISWHAPFIFIGILGIIIIPLVARFMRPMNEHLREGKKDNPIQVLKNVVNSKLQLTALALSGCLMLGHFLIIPFLNPYMEFNVGFTAHQRNLIYMVGGIASFVGAPVIGKLADKYGKHRIFTIFALLSLIPIFLITNMPPIKYYYVLMVTGVWFMLSTGRGIPAQAIISNVVAPEQRGSFMSFNSCIQQLFTGAASLIAGMVIVVGADNKLLHYSWTGYISIGVVLLCVFIAAKIPGKSVPQAIAKEESQRTVEGNNIVV